VGAVVKGRGMDTVELDRPGDGQAEAQGVLAVIPVGMARGFWPVVRMSDGTYRKGPSAEIVGWWTDG